jgi:hypothetical protein
VSYRTNTRRDVSDKDELLKLLAGVPAVAKEADALGKRISKSAQFADDMARVEHVVYTLVSEDAIPPAEWRRSIESWRAWYGAAENLKNGAGPHARTFIVTGSSTVSSTSASISVAFRVDPYILDLPQVRRAKAQYLSTLEHASLAESARESLARLQLDSSRKGQKSATELLAEAQGAFEHPAVEDAAASVLIPLRGCIETVFADLIRRRPQQEPAGKPSDKVDSLARQCPGPQFGPDHFKRLGEDIERLLGELSSAKTADMARDRVIDLYCRSLLWLSGFLDSLDEIRFKPPA